jgi:hypothetical protein
MIGIPLGLFYANATEWLVHKYILHGLGRNKDSFWAFHWHDHHKAARRNEHIDESYEESLLSGGDTPQAREAFVLAAATAAHLPLLPIAPFFTATLVYSAMKYYKVHKRSHLDPDWARQHLPWHYDHHMGPDQHANWGVTHPWFDQLMGTRKEYVGTERETGDIQRKTDRAARKRAIREQGRGAYSAAVDSEKSEAA